MAKSNSVSNTQLLWFILVVAVLTLVFVALNYFNNTNPNTQVRSNAASLTGNGAPNGSHYNLNIHGVPKNKTADMTGSDTHSIFVPEYGKCKINLFQGDFQVLDGNCTDDGSAA